MSTSGPFGTWTSPITAQVVATQGLRLGAPVVDGSDVYWLEGRPAEGGRNVLVRRAADGTSRELTPPGFNVRTRVHEYGGGAYVVHGGIVVFSTSPTSASIASTRAGAGGRARCRSRPKAAGYFADCGRGRRAQPAGLRARGSHRRRAASPSIPSSASRSTARRRRAGARRGLRLLLDAAPQPRWHAPGWICWRHPRMPWDGTELWVADVAAGRRADERAPRGRRRDGVDLPAGLVARTARCVRQRPRRLVAAYRGRPAGAAGSTRSRRVLQPPPPTPRPAGRSGSSARRPGPSRAPTRARRVVHARGPLAPGLRRSRHRRVPRARAGLEPGPWLAAADGEVVLVAGSADGAGRGDGACTLESGAAARAARRGGHVDRRGLPLRAAVARVSHRRRIARRSSSTIRRATATVGAARRRTAAAHRHQPRRPDRGRRLDARLRRSSSGPAAASPCRRELRRQHRLRPRVPRSGSTASGASWTWRIAIKRRRVPGARGQGRSARGSSSAAAAPAGYTTLAALTFYPDVFKAGASYYGISDLEALAARLAQVRGAVPRHPGRPLSGDARRSTRRGRRSTPSIGCRAR